MVCDSWKSSKAAASSAPKPREAYSSSGSAWRKFVASGTSSTGWPARMDRERSSARANIAGSATAISEPCSISAVRSGSARPPAAPRQVAPRREAAIHAAGEKRKGPLGRHRGAFTLALRPRSPPGAAAHPSRTRASGAPPDSAETMGKAAHAPGTGAPSRMAWRRAAATNASARALSSSRRSTGARNHNVHRSRPSSTARCTTDPSWNSTSCGQTSKERMLGKRGGVPKRSSVSPAAGSRQGNSSPVPRPVPGPWRASAASPDLALRSGGRASDDHSCYRAEALGDPVTRAVSGRIHGGAEARPVRPDPSGRTDLLSSRSGMVRLSARASRGGGSSWWRHGGRACRPEFSGRLSYGGRIRRRSRSFLHRCAERVGFARCAWRPCAGAGP